MKSDFDNWSDVRVFLAVLREGSTLAAARRLGMAQPTVARRIDALEHGLGLVLFERDTRGFRPTKAGLALKVSAEAMETAAQAFSKLADARRNADKGTIRITAPAQSFSPKFAGLLAAFTQAHPGTRFEFISTHELVDLAAGEADVALRFTQEVHDDRLICTRLTEVKTAFFASEDYVAQHGIPRDADTLDGHRFVLLHAGGQSFVGNEWIKARVTPDQIATECTTVDAVVTAIQAGFGIGPLPRSLAEDYQGLVMCFDGLALTSTYSWLLISPDAWRRPEIRAFSKFFAPRFRKLFRRPD